MGRRPALSFKRSIQSPVLAPTARTARDFGFAKRTPAALAVPCHPNISKLIQLRTIWSLQVWTDQHYITVLITHSADQDLRLKTGDPSRWEVHNREHLTTNQRLRRVVNRDLGARLADAVFAKINPQLYRGLARFGERFGPNDRPNTSSTFSKSDHSITLAR